MTKVALIDGDLISYRCAASCEPTKEKLEREPLDLAIRRADELLYRILNTTQTEEYRLFLSGSTNFRKQLYPLYKANRERYPRPEHLESVREFLVREWRGEICTGYEADDGIGIAAKEDFIICSNDKDFRQIEGEIYNPVKDEFEVVDAESAALNFFTHMVVGDASDNLPGIRGLGPVKARRLLDGRDAGEMRDIVCDLYGGEEHFIHAYWLFRILRSSLEYDAVLDLIETLRVPKKLEEEESRESEETCVQSVSKDGG